MEQLAIIVLFIVVVILGSMAFTPKITAACTAVNASDSCVFTCSINTQLEAKFQRPIPIDPIDGATSCAESGKVQVLAFHSPTCPYCEEQVSVLDQLEQKYGDALDIKYVCTSIHEGDDALCMNNSDGLYLPDEESKSALSKYASAIGGTPTLVLNCEFTRVGSYAIQDKTEEYNQLDTVLSLLGA